MAVRASDIPFGSDSRTLPDVEDRIFRERGDQRYSLELEPLGIAFEVDRLRREHHALHGELAVTVRPGALPHALTMVEDGAHYLTIGDLNFSAPRSITERANILKDRSRMDSLDWFGFLQEFVFRVTAAERKGKPASVLAEVPDDAEDQPDAWDIHGLPVLTDLPMVIFGEGGSGKSYLAMYIAGKLAERGVNVLYADWEFSRRDHRKRFARLFTPMPKGVFYINCDRPLIDEIDRIQRLIAHHRIGYVIFDSMVFALNGPADDERAGQYFRAARQTGLGGLHLAHTTKSNEDDADKKVYGSVFFSNGARSIWFCSKAKNPARGEHDIGLYHRKSNIGELLKPKGFKLAFRGTRTLVETIAVEDSEELSVSLPVLDRTIKLLRTGAMTMKGIADELNVPIGSIKSVFTRHKSKFVKTGNKYGVLGEGGVDF